MENKVRKDKPLLSVIVPVYNNTNQELKRCFNSILRQRLEDYEIIVVDDGSCKECASFLDSVALKNSKFRIFHQKNAGVSIARNKGVKFSKGRYVTFLDADDLLTENFFADVYKIINNLGEDNIDVLYGYAQDVRDPENICFNKIKKLEPIKLGVNLKKILYQYMFYSSDGFFRHNNFYVIRGPVAKVVKRSIAIENPFKTFLAIGEDVIWNLDFLTKKDLKLFFVRRPWYVVIVNSYSVTHRFTHNKVEQYSKFLTCLCDYINSSSLKCGYLSRTIRSLMEIEKSYDLFNIDGLSNRPNLYLLIQREPWNLAFKWKYAIHLNFKDLIKFILIKFNLADTVFPMIIKFKYRHSIIV